MRILSIFDTSVSNYNLGNQIIMDAVYSHLEEVFPSDFLYKVPYMDVTNHALSYLDHSHLAVWGGTNSLCGEMERYTQWGINADNVRYVKHKVVLMGLGWWQYQSKTSAYTARLLRAALSKHHLLSVRDQYSADKLSALGFDNVVNTGCPTLWELTPEHCREIPGSISSDTALMTFTDYDKDEKRDLALYHAVKRHYKNVVFWVQGVGDHHYITRELCLADEEILAPRLEVYNRFLEQYRPDYIGTRLHGGIRALQKKCRAIILSVDNRAKEMGRDFNLPVIENSEIESAITRNFPQITLPQENIRRWKSQFARGDEAPDAYVQMKTIGSAALIQRIKQAFSGL
jgi:polysaccharide pyruvyl transferase WcaK-like protein